MNNIFKKPWFLILLAAVVVSFFILFLGGVDMGIDLSKENGEEDLLEDSGVVMTVNGIDFTYNEFKSMMEQVEWEFQMEGRELDKEEIKETVIERVVQQAVLIDYARKEGLVPSKDEIEERFNEILDAYDMNEEEFLDLVKDEQGISTRKEIEDLLEGELMISRLFDRYIENIVVSEEEMISVYEEYIEELKAEGVEEGDFPDIEEMKEFIEENIKFDKASEELIKKAQELKENASIKSFLDDFDF